MDERGDPWSGVLKVESIQIPLFLQIISPGVDYNELQARSSDVSKSAVDRAIFDTRKITVGEMFLHTLNKATVAHHQQLQVRS